MQQQQRIESLGRLAGGVAHDFNNMLTVILGGLSYLLELPKTATLGEADIRDCIVDAIAAGKKSSELTSQLLSFARGHNRTSMAKLDLAELANEVLRIAQRTFGSSIKIERSIGRDLFMIGDRSQLTQVLMNLCLNARDAMPRGGTLSVSASRSRSSATSPPSIALSIKDTGTGMDEKTKKRVFDPFFTTKASGQGTGLGLSIVDGILKNHGGTIELESAPGQGATFTIHLPLMDRSHEEPCPSGKGALSTMERRKGAVLIVDDEDLQLRMTRRLVEGLGHSAIVAQDRARAIELFRERRSEIEIVLLDLVMPDGGGEAVYGELKAIDPKVRVLACSGYSAPERTNRILDLGARGFLQKPYDRHALQVALLQAMA
jgi:CheY-like chemotaxis protein/two-component sensor histidine kinase